MRGWFRRQKASANPSVEGMEAAFHGIIKQVRTEMTETQRMGVAYGVAFAWQAFNVKFSSAEGFLKLSSAAKTDFINGMEKMYLGVAEKGDAEVATGMSLANMYFAALLALSEKTGNAAMVNRMADQLEPFNREGSVLLNVGSPRNTPSGTREHHPLQVSADELPELIGAAERGDVDAQVRLSVAYRTGQGTAQNDACSVYWARCAAEQGNDRGQVLLASAYAEGRGVTRDAVAAAGWYRRSAEQGNPIAQRQLAIAYINGKGVQHSADEAAKWYRASGEQGDVVAQIGLGASYYGGDGVPQDYAEAAKWYERAAAYGDPNAQGRLADMYARGIGVSQDKVTALMWLLLADNDVCDDNREIIPAYRAHLSAILPPNDVAEAERRAIAWEPRTWPNDPIKDALLRMLPRRNPPGIRK